MDYFRTTEPFLSKKGIIAIVINILIFVIFGIAYGFYMKSSGDQWYTDDSASTNPWVNGLYLSAVTHTSLGYGDIYPKDIKAQSLVSMQVLLVFLINIYLGVSSLFSATPF